MFVKFLKGYFKNIWYFFALLGFVMLAVIIAVSFVGPSFAKSFNTLTSGIEGILKTYNLPVQQIMDSFTNKIKSLDFSNMEAVIRTITDPVWLQQTFTEILQPFTTQTEEILKELNTIFVTFADTSKSLFNQLLGSIGAGLLAGYVMISIFVQISSTRKDHAILRFVMYNVYNFILLGLLFLGSYALIKAWPAGVIVVFIVTMLLFSYLSLLVSWLCYAEHKYHLYKEVVSWKNIFISISSNVIFFVLSLIIVILLARFCNLTLAILVGVPLYTATCIVAETNAAIYVSENYSGSDDSGELTSKVEKVSFYQMIKMKIDEIKSNKKRINDKNSL